MFLVYSILLDVTQPCFESIYLYICWNLCNWEHI